MFKPYYWTRNDIRKLLKEIWNLEPQTNGLAYVRYDIDLAGIFYENNSIGRFYTIKKDFILEKYVELLN